MAEHRTSVVVKTGLVDSSPFLHPHTVVATHSLLITIRHMPAALGAEGWFCC